MKVKNSLDEILYEHIVESLINGDYEMGQNLTKGGLDEKRHGCLQRCGSSVHHGRLRR